MRVFVLLIVFLLRDVVAFEPTESYERREVAGFSVSISRAAREHPEELSRALEEFERQSGALREKLPREIVARLAQVPVWLEWQNKTNGAAEYHPSKEWLKAHGYNPAKAKAVEINNLVNFVRWSKDQPSMLLHELAHAYHDQVLGWEDADVKKSYEDALRSKRYEMVEHANGRKYKAYALTDEKEYFAEISEAYLGTNDFFPFVRSELKEFDGEAFSLMEKKWK